MPTDIQTEYQMKKEVEKRSMQNKKGAIINITGGQLILQKIMRLLMQYRTMGFLIVNLIRLLNGLWKIFQN